MAAAPLGTAFPESTAIGWAAYHPDRRVLDIKYEGGDLYSYFDVPIEIYQALCAAPSAGEYVNLAIKPAFAHEVDARRRRFRP